MHILAYLLGPTRLLSFRIPSRYILSFWMQANQVQQGHSHARIPPLSSAVTVRNRFVQPMLFNLSSTRVSMEVGALSSSLMPSRAQLSSRTCKLLIRHST